MSTERAPQWQWQQAWPNDFIVAMQWISQTLFCILFILASSLNADETVTLFYKQTGNSQFFILTVSYTDQLNQDGTRMRIGACSWRLMYRSVPAGAKIWWKVESSWHRIKIGGLVQHSPVSLTIRILVILNYILYLPTQKLRNTWIKEIQEIRKNYREGDWRVNRAHLDKWRWRLGNIAF